MHEVIFAGSILRELEQLRDKDKKIVFVSIDLGELVGISQEDLMHALSVASPYRFSILQVPSKVKCDCGYEGRANIEERMHDLVIYSCPNCGVSPHPIEGTTIKISKINYL